MDNEDLKGLKYYILYGIIVIGFFAYAGITGWKWFNPTTAEPTRSATRSGYIHRSYHK
jgi:hypothetical protein